jgi:hypothetical protein
MNDLNLTTKVYFWKLYDHLNGWIDHCRISFNTCTNISNLFWYIKTTFAVVVLPEVIACVCTDFPRVFLTIVVVQNEYLGARTSKCAKWMVNISEVNYAWKKVLRKYKLCLSRICRHFGIRHSLNLVNGDTVLNL